MILTEFLCGDSEPLALLAFCASDVPNLRASYTGSTLLPQASEENDTVREGMARQPGPPEAQRWMLKLLTDGHDFLDAAVLFLDQ